MRYFTPSTLLYLKDIRTHSPRCFPQKNCYINPIGLKSWTFLLGWQMCGGLKVLDVLFLTIKDVGENVVLST